MKKFYKLLFALIITFIFIVKVSAVSSTCSEENLNKIYEERGITKENDKLSIKENCYYQNGDKTDNDYKGCTRTNSSAQDAYNYSTESRTIAWTTTKGDYVDIKINSDIKRTKDYFVVGVKDNTVKGIYFAGCYQGYLKKNKIGKYEIVAQNDNSVSNKPVYYIKVLEPNSNGTCDLKATSKGDIFIPAGIELEYYAMDDHGVQERTVFTTDGTPARNGYGFQKYEFNGCPKYFNLGTSFPTWWSASLKNAFIFSDSSDIVFDLSWIRRTFSNENASSQATTAVDNAEIERVTQCYNNIKPSSYTCEELKTFSEKIYNEQKACNNENSNFFRDVDENVQTEMLQKVVTSLNSASSKIVSCQFASCNVQNQSLINKINDSKYSSCLNSCVSELKISNTKENKTYTNNCASCYKTFYNDLLTNNSITSEQKTCLDSQVNEYDKQLNNLQSNFAGIVNNNMEQALENKAHAAASTSYTKFTPPEMSGGVFGKGGSCSQILGSNGVKILKGVITTIRILAPIVALINAMIILLPAVTSKDADALKKASSKCVKLAVVLAIVEIFPSVIKLIGALFGWDTCGI